MPKSLGCAKSFLLITITTLYLCKVNVHVCIQAYVVKKPGRQLIRNTAVYTRKTGQSLLQPDFSRWIDSDSNGIRTSQTNKKKEFHQKEESSHKNRANVRVSSIGLRRSPQVETQGLNLTLATSTSKDNATEATVIKENDQIKKNLRTNITNAVVSSDVLGRLQHIARQGAEAIARNAPRTNIYMQYLPTLRGWIDPIIAYLPYLTDLPEAIKIFIRRLIERVFGTKPEKMDRIENKILSKIEDFKNKTEPIPERLLVMAERIIGVRNFRTWLNKIERLSNATVNWFVKEVVSKPEQVRDMIFRLLRVKDFAELEKAIEKNIRLVIDWINNDLMNIPDRVLQFIYRTLGTPAQKIDYFEKLTLRVIDWLTKDILTIPEQIFAAIDRVFNEALIKSVQTMWDTFMKSLERYIDIPSRLFEPILRLFPGAHCIGDVIRIMKRKSWIQSIVSGIRGTLNRFEIVRYFVRKIKNWVRQKEIWKFIKNRIFRPTPRPYEMHKLAFKPDSIVGAFGMPCDGKYSNALPLHPFDKKMGSIIGSYIYDLTHRSENSMEDGLPKGLNEVLNRARAEIANANDDY